MLRLLLSVCLKLCHFCFSFASSRCFVRGSCYYFVLERFCLSSLQQKCCCTRDQAGYWGFYWLQLTQSAQVSGYPIRHHFSVHNFHLFLLGCRGLSSIRAKSSKNELPCQILWFSNLCFDVSRLEELVFGSKMGWLWLHQVLLTTKSYDCQRYAINASLAVKLGLDHLGFAYGFCCWSGLPLLWWEDQPVLKKT